MIKLIIIIAILIIFAVLLYLGHTSEKELNSQMSFRESMDLTDLPVVTFYQGNKKVNFLLDTGSNDSIINEEAVKKLKLEHEKLDVVSEIYGIGGKTFAPHAKIAFKYKDLTFKYNFQVVDLSPTFNTIKEQTGVVIHGILGSCVFREYKYILDFNNLVAYSKK